jgi:pre-mRNA-processing factor SLU7
MFSLSRAAFGEVKKRVRTTAGGSTGSVRNLRIREDTAKYLLNLDTNSAHYDPKSRSMREDPNPNKVGCDACLCC